ncbi:MAG: ABC transporter permease [Alphaproteobacteria bacterium]|nr:ABC transporter permease [Alphaproteobacteria bacterium]MCY3753786.1 ABC transporter permease [Alphaproteobacteria bacterium]MDE0408119.1 ABC transporter permease [Alphaproteobacteria bacterium]
MPAYTLKRTFVAFLILIVVSGLTFSLSHLSADPALTIGGEQASEEDIQAIRKLYGFDRPIHVQYLDWLGRALSGDFGESYHYKQRVFDMVSERIGRTMLLGTLAILFALAVSIPLGTLAAMRPNSIVDRIALFIAVLGQALPTFWFALMMIIVFGVWWRWLPISGHTQWANYVMPTIALGYYATPALMRLTRAGMIEVLGSDYIRTARAKGLSPASVLFKHALRNAIIPVVALAAVWFGFMLGGSIVIETIFNLKGIGWLSYDALLRSDLPVVQAIVLVFASFYVVLTLLADLLNAYLDPRISVR